MNGEGERPTTMTLKLDIWKNREGLTALLFSGDLGNEGRSTLDNDYEVVHSFHAGSHFEAMTKYYEYMDWGVYTTEFDVDKDPYDLKNFKGQMK